MALGSWLQTHNLALTLKNLNMKNYRSIPILILSLIFIISGCGLSSDNKAAEKTAVEFYTALKSGDAAKAASLCGTDEVMTTKAWQDLFAQNLNSLGKVVAFDKGSGFNVSIENGASTVLLNYNVTYEYAKSKDSLSIIETGDGFKIYKYEPELKEAKFKEEIAQAEIIAGKYFEFLSKGDYQTAMSYIGYSGLQKYQPVEWTNFYSDMDRDPGKIKSYKLDKESSTSYLNTDYPDAGKGNVYIILFITSRGNYEVTEKIELFQPKFGEPIKIVNHIVK